MTPAERAAAPGPTAADVSAETSAAVGPGAGVGQVARSAEAAQAGWVAPSTVRLAPRSVQKHMSPAMPSASGMGES